MQLLFLIQILAKIQTKYLNFRVILIKTHVCLFVFQILENICGELVRWVSG